MLLEGSSVSCPLPQCSPRSHNRSWWPDRRVMRDGDSRGWAVACSSAATETHFALVLEVAVFQKGCREVCLLRASHVADIQKFPRGCFATELLLIMEIFRHPEKRKGFYSTYCPPAPWVPQLAFPCTCCIPFFSIPVGGVPGAWVCGPAS